RGAGAVPGLRARVAARRGALRRACAGARARDDDGDAAGVGVPGGRDRRAGPPGPMKSLDPVTLEVVRNALPAIANEMAADLQRTSYNMMIYEVRDFCTALLDVDGALIAQNVGGVSHFVADLGVVVADGVARYGRGGFAPGDVLIT